MDAMYTIESDHGPPTIAEAAQMLQVQESDLDPDFGIILIDPKRGLYTVRIRDQSAAHPDTSRQEVDGPFADPGIGLFGPVKP
jgi:hypothetical protein